MVPRVSTLGVEIGIIYVPRVIARLVFLPTYPLAQFFQISYYYGRGQRVAAQIVFLCIYVHFGIQQYN